MSREDGITGGEAYMPVPELRSLPLRVKVGQKVPLRLGSHGPVVGGAEVTEVSSDAIRFQFLVDDDWVAKAIKGKVGRFSFDPPARSVCGGDDGPR